ncbi:chromosome segregation protein SMC [Bifidobacterium platyrrhinorum]|uniref:Chromosome partition protein Smc n=1 Tax=Bifidobacterium platyrrhinorum TaxID=2661628 RepID=A0A6L9SSB6_9BIFI|nr:chromosome segregation protein SMC [Bifidobacterium platyrrhinorum]NEG54412.1 chromosome segregation protein SMC [Bifidobacterium platyrrhinorum]
MYLKELTLRGFKSFASATTLRFEPGITAVVGPNGSGKSNIVDALTWVMGEQGARNLRGASMEDVIFAGTSTRPALGRAQVSLTIDNADHALDIDYAEVTISRTIFRNGGSEYAINGTPCRLLDIQELLSDTGLGQQMHVIVGQGRLDRILRADPSGHRAFIEEAAGILKHRKRKERALRKLANTESNLNRLDDLLGEIHRQLGPLGRQARISRRAEAIRISLRDAQARLYADDAAQAMRARAEVHADLTRVRGELSAARRELAQVKVRIDQVEAQASKGTPAMDRADRSWRDLTQLGERFASLASIAEERGRSLLSQVVEHPGEDPDILDRRAGELESQAKAQSAAVDDARIALDKATEARAGDERRLAAIRQTLTELRRTAQERDARVARLRELVAREESAVELCESRARDFAAQRVSLAAQHDETKAQLDRLRGEADAVDGDDGALDEARALLAERRAALDALLEERRGTQSRIISLEAKAEALKDTLDSRNASGSLESDAGVEALGRLADFIHVAEGWEDAVAHALGRYAGALVVPGEDNMLHALERAREDRLGRATVIRALDTAADVRDDVPGAGIGADDGAVPADDGTPTPLASMVGANPSAPDAALARRVVGAVRVLLADAVAVATALQAQRIVSGDASRAPFRAVTKAGEVFSAGVAAAGDSAPSRSDLSLAARRDKALHEAASLTERLGRIAHRVEEVTRSHDEASRAVEAITRRRTETRLKAEQAERSTQAAVKRLADLDRQLTMLDERMAAIGEERSSHRSRLDDLHAALKASEDAGHGRADSDELSARERDLESALGMARDQEVATKIAWTEASRRAESLTRQAVLLRGNAKEARERRARIEELNTSRREQAAHANRIAADAREAAAMVDAAVSRVVARRERLQAEASDHSAELKALRERRNGIEPKTGELTAREHALDVDRERLAAACEQITRRVSDDLGMTLEELAEQYGPDLPVPVLDASGNPIPLDGGDDCPADGPGETHGGAATAYRTVPYVRDEQRQRLEKAKRDLAALGKVNPLATEEYDALEARNRYLNEQRNDVAKSRDDLMGLIGDLDSTMVEVFRSAFEDTAKAFESMFATLFPGGTGRLRLENPSDMLSTGVIVEASPAGKRVRQLSLLSGGERSLTALALLFAIFTARPSPFYVMDEVEAALDDVNLTRLINALERLRERAQLIVITHQQRTMAIADALYGVTMRDDGVTAVVSQRMERPGAADRDTTT